VEGPEGPWHLIIVNAGQIHASPLGRHQVLVGTLVTAPKLTPHGLVQEVAAMAAEDPFFPGDGLACAIH